MDCLENFDRLASVRPDLILNLDRVAWFAYELKTPQLGRICRTIFLFKIHDISVKIRKQRNESCAGLNKAEQLKYPGAQVIQHA